MCSETFLIYYLIKCRNNDRAVGLYLYIALDSTYMPNEVDIEC